MARGKKTPEEQAPELKAPEEKQAEKKPARKRPAAKQPAEKVSEKVAAPARKRAPRTRKPAFSSEELSQAEAAVKKAGAWLGEGFDKLTRDHVWGLVSARNERELAECFGGELEFGTAGLRGILGIGSLRMNRYTVARAAYGLARCLMERYPLAAAAGVVIGYDCRRDSDVFARVTAEVLCAAGIRAFLFDSMVGTPQVPFAIRRLAAFAGVMITSSHNPPQYNGVKVYWGSGAQIISPVDKEIAERMPDDWSFVVPRISLDEATEKGLLKMLGGEFIRSYADWAVETATPRDLGGVKVVYTPLGGMGWRFVSEAFSRAGCPDPIVVPEERDPSPSFAGLAAPNPEIPATLTRALALAREQQADLILATDGDSDRIGVAVADSGGDFVLLSGNQVGVLMLAYLLEYRKETCWTGREFAVSSVVSTPMSARICAHYGARFVETLTGFKWMGSVSEELVQQGGDFVLAFEEAFGVTFGDSRDKDGVISVLLLAELASYCKIRGLTLLDWLDRLYQRHGLHLEDAAERFYEGVEGKPAMARVLSGLRAEPPAQLAGSRVVRVRDVLRGVVIEDGAETPVTHLPSQDLLTFYTEDGSWVSIRPSGTEPKVKAYVGVVLPCTPVDMKQKKAEARERLALLKREAESLLAPR